MRTHGDFPSLTYSSNIQPNCNVLLLPWLHLATFRGEAKVVSSYTVSNQHSCSLGSVPSLTC